MGNEKYDKLRNDINKYVQHDPSEHDDRDPKLRSGRGNEGHPDSDGKLDETIHEFKDYFDFMEKITPLFERWREHPCAHPGKRGKWKSVKPLNKTDKDDLEQLKGLHVGHLAALREVLSNAAKAVGELDGHSSGMGKTLDHNWSGPNSDKAIDKFTELSKGARDFKKQVDELSTHVRGVHRSAYNAKEKLLEVLDAAFKDDSGIIDKEGVGKDNDTAKDRRGMLDGCIDDLNDALKYGMKEVGSGQYSVLDKDEYGKLSGLDEVKRFSPEELRHHTKNNINYNNAMHGSGEVVYRLDRLCINYNGSLLFYRKALNAARENLNSAFGKLRSAMGDVQPDPFGKLVAPGDTPPAGHSKHSGNGDQPKHQQPPKTKPGAGGNTNPADSGGGGGDSGGGDSGGGGSDAGDQGGTAMPKDGQGSDSGPSRATGSSPQVAPEQSDDGSGGRASMPGRGDSEQSAMPEQGQQQMPGQAGSGQPQTVSVKGPEGQDIQMSSPDGQGNMKLTIDDGSGHPKSYDVDFSQDSGQTPGGGQPGQDGTADLQDAQGAGGEAQGLGQEPGQSDGMPGQSGDTQGQPGGGPDQAQGMPGQSGDMTGQAGDTSGQLGGAADQSAGLTGQPGGMPDQSQGMPGQSGDMSSQLGGMADQDGGVPGQPDGALGSPGDASGQAGDLSGQLGGADGQADGMPDHPGDSSGQPGGAQGQADALSGQPGDAQGSSGDVAGQSGSQDGSQHVQADEQGHAEIHDGDTKITVDKSPDSDEVKVTVDDGSGEPTSYTLDSGSDGGPDGSGADQAAGDGGASGATSSSGSSLAAALDGGGSTDAVDTGAGGAHDASDTTEPSHASGSSDDFGAGAGATPNHGAGASHGDGGAPDAGGGADSGGGGASGLAGDGPGSGQLQEGSTTDADPSMAGGSDSGAGSAVGGGSGGHGGGAPGGGAGAAAGGEGGGHGGGGMPMMGGMGGMGGGGDQERQASAWRTEGNLFDDLEDSLGSQAEDFLTGRD